MESGWQNLCPKITTGQRYSYRNESDLQGYSKLLEGFREAEFEKEVAATGEAKAEEKEEVKAQDTIPETTTITEQDNCRCGSKMLKKPLVDCGTEQVKEDSGNGLVFVLGFLGGLIALLTPCVFQ
ncbi:hypothetical protein FQR65_LT16302 [Abscondita terminalis]|nr:hypothetical protein FQR65_LT16302 [Abscondita terminalis]